MTGSDALDRLLAVHLGVRHAAARADATLERRRVAGPYFRDLIHEQAAASPTGAIWGVSWLFYSLLGALLCDVAPTPAERNQLITLVYGLQSSLGGFMPVSQGHWLAQRLNRLGQPDIYATTYALGCLDLLDAPASAAERARAVDWIRKQVDPDGWIYQRLLGDTLVPRKFQNEVALQAHLALTALRDYGYGPFDGVAFASTKMVLEALVPAMRYLGPLYHALASLAVLGGASPGAQEAAFDFVRRHCDGGGFLEYHFLEAKIDEVAGHIQRFQSDYLAPSITASYRALQILQTLGTTTAAEWWAEHRQAVEGYFAALEPATGGGFGSRLQIAKYQASFGPVETPLESLMVICAPALIGAIP